MVPISFRHFSKIQTSALILTDNLPIAVMKSGESVSSLEKPLMHLFMRPPYRRAITAHCQREIINLSITSGCQYNCMCCMPLYFSGIQITYNNPACFSVNHHQIQHFVTGKQFYTPFTYLSHQCLISPQ